MSLRHFQEINLFFVNTTRSKQNILNIDRYLNATTLNIIPRISSSGIIFRENSNRNNENDRLQIRERNFYHIQMKKKKLNYRRFLCDLNIYNWTKINKIATFVHEINIKNTDQLLAVLW